VAVAITRLDAAAVAFELLAASSVVGSASNELVDAVQANVAEANAASAAAATAGGAAGGRGRALASARLASLIAPEPPQSTTDTPAARPRESSTGLNRSPAGKSGSGSGSGSHLSSEAEAPEAAGLAEKLVEEMIVLFASQADACGFVGKAELLRISASARLGELTARTALLRRVEPSTLGADAQLAFWLNVYNLCCMHGFAVNAKLLPTNGSVLSVLRLHSNFVYNIGGRSLSVVDIEHAVLRASQPRPSFLISFLIPKFALSDPRRDLAFAALPSPLLSFGLVAGTAFSPPLRTFGRGCPRAARAECACCPRADGQCARRNAGPPASEPARTAPMAPRRRGCQLARVAKWRAPAFASTAGSLGDRPGGVSTS